MSSQFHLSARSLSKLDGVCDELVRVVKLAIEITPQDFSAIEGLRTIETQRVYVARGVSKTMRSRHLTGHAVDLVPYFGRGISPWPSHHPRHKRAAMYAAFEQVARAMFDASDALDVLIQWGNDWDMDGIPVTMDPDENFADMPHFQIPRGNREILAEEASMRRVRLRELGEDFVS